MQYMNKAQEENTTDRKEWAVLPPTTQNYESVWHYHWLKEISAVA